MTYNSTPRRRFTKLQREEFLRRHDCTCYWCREKILPSQPWAIEHKIARELMPGKEADADHNLAPIHAHPMECHKLKTRLDAKLIAKSNRIRKNFGLDPVKAKPRPKMKSRNTFDQAGKRAWPKRPFPTRRPA